MNDRTHDSRRDRPWDRERNQGDRWSERPRSHSQLGQGDWDESQSEQREWERGQQGSWGEDRGRREYGGQQQGGDVGRRAPSSSGRQAGGTYGYGDGSRGSGGSTRGEYGSSGGWAGGYGQSSGYESGGRPYRGDFGQHHEDWEGSRQDYAGESFRTQRMSDPDRHRSGSDYGTGNASAGYGSGERQSYGREFGSGDYGGGQHGERGFLARAGDEIASWFGDEDAARRREQDHRGHGPSDYRRSDERIREDANDRLTDDSAVDARNISVSVSNGEITLNGTVPSREQKRRAEDCVDRISGVKHVQNNLRVSQSGSSATASNYGGGAGAMGSGSSGIGAARTTTGTAESTQGTTGSGWSGSTGTTEGSGAAGLGGSGVGGSAIGTTGTSAAGSGVTGPGTSTGDTTGGGTMGAGAATDTTSTAKPRV